MSFDPDEPIFPPGIPEEYKEQIMEHRRHHEAHMQDNTHSVKYFLEALDQDGLTALDTIVVNVMSDPQYNGAYFRGQITQLAQQKFDICPCGQSHDPTEAFQLPPATRPGAPRQPNEDTHLKGRPIEDVALPDDGHTKAELMALYGLEEDLDHDITCKNCGTHYVSLEDRMVKDPGTKGCDGCQQKAKWG